MGFSLFYGFLLIIYGLYALFISVECMDVCENLTPQPTNGCKG